MHRLASFVGARVDALWRVSGLDLDRFAQAHPERAERIGVWLLAAGQTIGYAGLYYIFAALLISWDTAFDWGKASLTFTFMSAIIVSAAISPIAGALIDRGRGRWLLGGGMALGALALTGLSAAETYAAFFGCWLLLGAAQGMCLYEPCFAFLTRTTGARATANITRVTLVAGFASTLAFPAGAFLAEALGWPGAVAAFAAVVAIFGATSMFAGATLIECCPEEEASDVAKTRDRAAVSSALSSAQFWLIFLAFPLIGLTEGIVLTHILPILTGSGLALSEAVFVSALFGPMQVAGRLFMMALGDRAPPVVMTMISFAGVLIAVLLLMRVGDVRAAAYAFAILFGASYGLTSILKPVVTAHVLGRVGFGKISALVAAPFLISLAVSPQLGSILEEIGGYELALDFGAATACVALLAIGALTALRRGAG